MFCNRWYFHHLCYIHSNIPLTEPIFVVLFNVQAFQFKNIFDWNQTLVIFELWEVWTQRVGQTHCMLKEHFSKLLLHFHEGEELTRQGIKRVVKTDAREAVIPWLWLPIIDQTPKMLNPKLPIMQLHTVFHHLFPPCLCPCFSNTKPLFVMHSFCSKFTVSKPKSCN